MPALAPATIVFDLDGTLADTAPDLVATLNVIMTREGLPPVPLDSARDMIGAGARALVERGFEAAGRELTPARSDELYRFFLAHYAEHLCEETRLFPGVEAALAALAGRGHRLAVCTNKVEAHSRRLLDALGIAPHFAAICGRDSFLYFKPDPRHLTLTVEAAGGDPARAIMVGDSGTDVATARAAGLPVIAVPFGYTDVPVAALGPDLIVERFADLPAAVDRLEAASDGGRDRD